MSTGEKLTLARFRPPRRKGIGRPYKQQQLEIRAAKMREKYLNEGSGCKSRVLSESRGPWIPAGRGKRLRAGCFVDGLGAVNHQESTTGALNRR